MTAIVPFTYEDQTVRVVEVGGEPWFVAADVCAVLGLSQVTRALSKLDSEDVTLTQIKGSHRPTNLITESGLYTLVLRSDKPQAKPFQKWVTKEVLPSIRKTGGYQAPITAADQLIAQAQMLKQIELRQAEQDARLSQIEARQDRMDGDTGYMTVLAFSRMTGLNLPSKEANALGRKAAKQCRDLGYSLGTAPDERYGRVNSYPVHVLEGLL